MPSFSISRDVIGLLRPVVAINGSRMDAVKCTSISYQPGCGGVRAEITIPQYLFDTNRRSIADGLISVRMRNTYDNSDDGDPDFVGYIDVDNADLSPGNDGVNLSAVSITGFLNKVGIGDHDNQPVLKYPLVDPLTGAPTGWTPKRVLRDLLDRLPPRYRNRIALGESSVLDTTELMELPDLEFKFQNYAQAIDSILAMFGDVTFTEHFRGGTCYLDFYRIQDVNSPTARVAVGNYRDVVASAVDVESLGHSQTTNDAVTRVKAYGTRLRYIISLVNYGENVEAQLSKGWNPALEADVLKDPKRAKPGAPGYVPGMELVFRRFYLPACLRPYTMLKDLGIRRAPASGQAEGPMYKPQVWKLPTLLALDEETAEMNGTEQSTGQLIKQCKLELDKGYIELGNIEDGLNITNIKPSDSGALPHTTWAPAKIGITLCVEGNRWLVADTGASSGSGINYDITSDGLFDRITRDDLTYVQMTTVGSPLPLPSGGTAEFTAYFYNEDTHTWQNYVEALPVKDDYQKLLTIAREHLRARNCRHHSFDVTVFYFSRAFRPGYRFVVKNYATWPRERMTITGVTYDLENNATTVTADSVKPPSRRRSRINQ